MTIEDQTADDLQMSIEDKLSDLAADLVSVKSHEPILKCLFASPEGKWLALADLCNSDNHLKVRTGEIESETSTRVLVSWISYPESSYGPGYGTIIFFVESIHWGTIALYNMGRLLRQTAAKSGR